MLSRHFILLSSPIFQLSAAAVYWHCCLSSVGGGHEVCPSWVSFLISSPAVYMVPKLPKHLKELQKNPPSSQVSCLWGWSGARGAGLAHARGGAAVSWCWGKQQVPPAAGQDETLMETRVQAPNLPHDKMYALINRSLQAQGLVFQAVRYLLVPWPSYLYLGASDLHTESMTAQKSNCWHAFTNVSALHFWNWTINLVRLKWEGEKTVLESSPVAFRSLSFILNSVIFEVELLF